MKSQAKALQIKNTEIYKLVKICSVFKWTNTADGGSSRMQIDGMGSKQRALWLTVSFHPG